METCNNRFPVLRIIVEVLGDSLYEFRSFGNESILVLLRSVPATLSALTLPSITITYLMCRLKMRSVGVEELRQPRSRLHQWRWPSAYSRHSVVSLKPERLVCCQILTS